MMKVVTIYNGDDWGMVIPLENSKKTREMFEDWHMRSLENGIEMYRSSIGWYDKKSGEFKKAWAFREGEWRKVEYPIRPDVIFDKLAGKYDYSMFDFKMSLLKKVKIFNHPLFRTILNNKLAQYMLLGEFMPRSFLASNHFDFSSCIGKIKSKKAVVKPLYGSGGLGIVIEDKSKIKKDSIEYPVLVQEFVKSNKGIPGISRKKEVSDLRLVYMNHRIVYAVSRIAKEGSLFTNFHMGATAVLIPEKSIPSSVKSIASKIVGKLDIFPEANYSLDFIFTDSGKPVLIEVNTTPGFDLLMIVGDEKIKSSHFNQFLDVFRNNPNDKKK